MIEKSNKINVLYLIDNLKIGGAQKVVFTLSGSLSLEKYNVYTICLGESGPFYNKFIEKGLNIEVLGIKKLTHLVRLRSVVRVIREKNIIIMHSFLFHSNFIGRIIGRLSNTPLVICAERAPGIWKPFLFKVAEKMVKGMAHVYTSVSESTKNFMVDKEGIDPDKVFTIYNGIDIKKSIPGCADAKILKKELGIDSHAIIIGSVGRLADERGYKYLIRAFKEISEKYADAVLLLVGDGPLKDELMNEAMLTGVQERIVFSGFREDVDSMLDIMDIFVISSWYEGISNALLEAMFHNLPVVATSIYGNPEVVVDGETGILVPSRNVSALANALVKLLENPDKMKSMGDNGRKRIESDFSLSKMIESYDCFYDSMLRAKGETS